VLKFSRKAILLTQSPQRPQRNYINLSLILIPSLLRQLRQWADTQKGDTVSHPGLGFVEGDFIAMSFSSWG